jgi:hypothetical protein
VSLRSVLSGRGVRAATGGALIVDGLVGIDVPGRRKRAGLFGSLLMALLGVLLVGLGWYWHGLHRPYPDGIAATATVTKVQTSQSAKGNVMYSRVYTFQTEDGRRVHFTEPEQSNRRPDLGTTATVSYRPADPEGARVIPQTDWMAFGMMAVGGLIAVVGTVTVGIRLVTLVVGVYLLGSAARRRAATR